MSPKGINFWETNCFENPDNHGLAPFEWEDIREKLRNHHFGRLNTGRMKIRGVMARKGDIPEYVNVMQQEVFRRYMDELDGADVRELAIHRRVSRMKYSRRCAEVSTVQAHLKRRLPLAPEMEISYVIRDARKWEVKIRHQDLRPFGDTYRPSLRSEVLWV
jgi:hypothetical protein